MDILASTGMFIGIVGLAISITILVIGW